MEIYVGTPPTKQMVSLDTGSSMSWIQCLPCEHCFKQNQLIFNSNRSSSYQVLRCDSSECLKLGSKRDCTRSNEKCKYRLSYDDKAGSSGELAKETYTVGDTSIPNMAHGCGHKNRGNFSEQSTGMIGLANGPISFFGQTRYLTGGKFSYCLVSQIGSNQNARSRISFGKNAVVSGPGVISTPLSKKKGSSFYFLTLKSISVRNIIIPFPVRKSIIPFIRQPGNIMIDSGTTINYFPSDVLRNLKTALIRVIGKTPFNIADELCYEINTDIPNITFHFASHANITLSKMNTFTVYGNALCLDMKQDDSISIFGNRSQMNFLVGYDIPRKKMEETTVTEFPSWISWKSALCLKKIVKKFEDMDLLERVYNTQFISLFTAPILQFSGTIVHHMLLRRVSSNSKEINFMVNGHELIFGMKEYALVTGMYFGSFPELNEEKFRGPSVSLSTSLEDNL
ncbi:aspartic proteinase CDR1-like [Impatiens glandulifera]|uniref:aspartic proteinase CDR1-like n=1 Tax=Impatiens glandulifera TaxID=253017 RepID=UPI001FB0B266|nr:aspartic proteinase CDR1-like [Impatiens glandulifera]